MLIIICTVIRPSVLSTIILALFALTTVPPTSLAQPAGVQNKARCLLRFCSLVALWKWGPDLCSYSDFIVAVPHFLLPILRVSRLLALREPFAGELPALWDAHIHRSLDVGLRRSQRGNFRKSVVGRTCVRCRCTTTQSMRQQHAW